MSGKGVAGRLTKNKKKTISLKTKLDILRRFEKGEKAVEIARAVGLAATTVRTIRDRDGDKIREAARSGASLDCKTMTRTRCALFIKMESLLYIWIEEQIAHGIQLSKTLIQAKAKSLFDEIKTKAAAAAAAAAAGDNSDGVKIKNQTFEASQGWFERFKVRANLHNIAFKGEGGCGDATDAAAEQSYAKELKAVIREGGYHPKQVFNVDETALFWKRLPKRTFISKMEKLAPGLTAASNDRLTLLLGGNANGDFKFKPFVVYHSETPRAMRGCSKNLLPVHWRASKKSWMTSILFQNWVLTCAIPEIKAYCNEENLNFKALILLDNAPGHPVYVDDLSDDVKFVFLPRNATPIVQPMNQGVISTFKSYYLRRTFKLLLSEAGIRGRGKAAVVEFWKNFDIVKAVNIISDSWKEVDGSCMNGAWRKIWPECVRHVKCAAGENDASSLVRREISDLARQFDFDGMDESDINEFLASHNREMTSDELLQLELRYSDDEDGDGDPGETEVAEKNLTTKQISDAMRLIDEAMQILTKNDPDGERSSKVANAVAANVNCYKELYFALTKKSCSANVEALFGAADRGGLVGT